MESLLGLAHIGIYTDNLERSKYFYVNNLNFKLEYETTIHKDNGKWSKIALLRLGELIVELVEPSDKANINLFKNGSIDHISIKVKNIYTVVEKLKKNNIIFETEHPIKIEKLFSGVLTIFFKGPNGERLELFEYL